MQYDRQHQPALMVEQFKGAVNFFMLMGGAEPDHLEAAALIIDDCYCKGWDPLSTARHALNAVTDGEYERSLKR